MKVVFGTRWSASPLPSLEDCPSGRRATHPQLVETSHSTCRKTKRGGNHTYLFTDQLSAALADLSNRFPQQSDNIAAMLACPALHQKHIQLPFECQEGASKISQLTRDCIKKPGSSNSERVLYQSLDIMRCPMINWKARSLIIFHA